jgi:hypothetical protein
MRGQFSKAVQHVEDKSGSEAVFARPTSAQVIHNSREGGFYKFYTKPSTRLNAFISG